MKPINPKRSRQIKDGKFKKGPVVYLMSRDQRANDNWALLFAQEKAIEKNQPLIVCFCLDENFPNANIRHFDFMLRGLKDAELILSDKNIPFILLAGNPIVEYSRFIKEMDASVLVTDFSPLKVSLLWKNEIMDKIDIPFYEIDAHNIVPVWNASDKQEFAARTLRPKINSKLAEFLEEFPETAKQKSYFSNKQKVNWLNIISKIKTERTVFPVENYIPGENQAFKMLTYFINNKLKNYVMDRNDPNIFGQSNLSPYLHFGQISSQRIALEVQKSKTEPECKNVFLEELIIRKELSDNYCFYNSKYDSFAGLPNWSQKTLTKHAKDKRQYLYSLIKFENAETHDSLWNKAQKGMTKGGKMHGFMRMYWAKKILEWTRNPQDAIKIAIYLNDKYSLDGRDPNGYVGVLWSIGGLHDRPWFERPVYGNIRYMNENGCRKKFDVDKYISSG